MGSNEVIYPSSERDPSELLFFPIFLMILLRGSALNILSISSLLLSSLLCLSIIKRIQSITFLLRVLFVSFISMSKT